jgi:hypothetical protein
MTEKDYPTDRFGNPDGRNYHYRIPLNNDKAMRLATWALHEMVYYQDRFVTEWDEYSGDRMSYMGIQTHDNKGHLDKLAKYAHSPKWQNMGVMSDIDEYRSGTSGGTKVKGSFGVDPMSFNGISTLTFETTLDVTPTELEDASENRGDVWKDIQMSIRWAKDESMENAHEQIAEMQRDCSHDHVIEGTIGLCCEDCGAEIEESEDGYQLAY